MDTVERLFLAIWTLSRGAIVITFIFTFWSNGAPGY